MYSFLIVLSCLSLPSIAWANEYDDAIAMVNAKHDEAKVGDGAPLVLAPVMSEEGKKAFMTANCEGKKNKECDEKFGKYTAALIARAYPGAHYNEVEQECSLQVGVCDKSAGYEKLVRASHNASVEANRASQLASLAQWKASSDYANAQARSAYLIKAGQVMMGLSQQLAPKPVTHCSARPDGVGGVQMECR
jgi:hypothetical protein